MQEAEDRNRAFLVSMTGIAAVLIIAVVMLVSGYNGSLKAHPGTFAYFTANGRTFNITANQVNMQEWEHGLMNATVTNSTFMLFVFGSYAIWDFWMFDTYYNLDIIWINMTNSTGKVVYIAANVPGCFRMSNCTVYDPNTYANYVLEAKGGFAAKNGVTVGSIMKFGN